MNADVVLGKQGAVFTHNLYAYCSNNPINCYDLNGKDALSYAEQWGRNMGPYLSAAGFSSLVDGLLPFGEIIAVGITVFGMIKSTIETNAYINTQAQVISGTEAQTSENDQEPERKPYYIAVAFFDNSPIPISAGMTLKEAENAMRTTELLNTVTEYVKNEGYAYGYVYKNNVPAYGIIAERRSDAKVLAIKTNGGLIPQKSKYIPDALPHYHPDRRQSWRDVHIWYFIDDIARLR